MYKKRREERIPIEGAELEVTRPKQGKYITNSGKKKLKRQKKRVRLSKNHERRALRERTASKEKPTPPRNKTSEKNHERPTYRLPPTCRRQLNVRITSSIVTPCLTVARLIGYPPMAEYINLNLSLSLSLQIHATSFPAANFKTLDREAK